MSENPGSGGQEKRHELDEEYRKLWELRDASEGAKILFRNRAMTNSYRVFEGNLAELKKILDHIATPTVMAHMWAEKHRYRLDYARREVSRLLHNYVASALSLADATRYFVDKHYAGTDLYDDYELRKNRDFAEAPLHNFMNKLRVYTLHLQLPAVTPIAHAERREDGGLDFDNTFWLDVERLRDWDGWTAKAREYLATLGSKARLMDIINAYEPVVTGFHEWLSDRISEEHAAAIEEVRDLERRMDEVWRELHGDLDQNSPAQELPDRESILASLAGPSLDDDVNNLATLDDIIFSLYESVSFPHGGLPNLDRFRSLFLRDTRLVKVEAHGTYLTNINDHIRDFHHTLNEGAITQVSEYEVSRRTNTLGDTAHVLSEHETVYVENGSRKRARGYYSLHLVKAGDRWCITDMHFIDVQSFTTREAPRSEPEVSVAEQYTTKTVQVRSLEPREDAEIPLFEAPFDGLIANVTFTPSEEIRGAYTSRGELQLYVDPRAGSRHIVSSIQLGSPEILLPGGERHNAPLLMPPVSLRVREGDSLVWSSIGSVGEGLEVPASEVEVVFERKDIAEDASPPELWRECVPAHWIGKDVLVEHGHRDIHGPRRPRGGSYNLYTWESVGTFEEADLEVIAVRVHTIEHGRLPRDTGFPYTQVIRLKLMEDE